MTNFSFGRTDGRTERGNNNIPDLSSESAGIKIYMTIQFLESTLILGMKSMKTSCTLKILIEGYMLWQFDLEYDINIFAVVSLHCSCWGRSLATLRSSYQIKIYTNIYISQILGLESLSSETSSKLIQNFTASQLWFYISYM